MTIQEMNNALAKMKKVYNFDEKTTIIRLEGSKSLTVDDAVRIRTEDKETGVSIEMYERNIGDV